MRIFQLLEESGLDLHGLKNDEAFVFEKEDDLHVVMFKAEGDGKGFEHFTAAGFRSDTTTLYELLFTLQERSGAFPGSKALFDTIRNLQQRIDSLEAKKLDFDAH